MRCCLAARNLILCDPDIPEQFDLIEHVLVYLYIHQNSCPPTVLGEDDGALGSLQSTERG